MEVGVYPREGHNLSKQRTDAEDALPNFPIIGYSPLLEVGF